MNDLISVGDTTIDLYFKGDSLTKGASRFQLAMGGKYFVDYFHIGVGGGGANVAINTAKAGCKAVLMTKIGRNHFEKIILDRLKTAGVSVKLTSLEKNYYNLSVILLTKEGERTIINYQNRHGHLLTHNYGKNLDLTSQTRMVYFGNLPDVSLTERKELIKKLRKVSQKVIINFGVNDCRRDRSQLDVFFHLTDGLIVNRYEFADLVKKDPLKLNLKNNLLSLLPELKGKFLIITDADKGSYGYEGANVYYSPPAKAKIIDTTGAGDSYTAGFISQYLKTNNVHEAMAKGTIAAARILAKVGAN